MCDPRYRQHLLALLDQQSFPRDHFSPIRPTNSLHTVCPDIHIPSLLLLPPTPHTLFHPPYSLAATSSYKTRHRASPPHPQPSPVLTCPGLLRSSGEQD